MHVRLTRSDADKYGFTAQTPNLVSRTCLRRSGGPGISEMPPYSGLSSRKRLSTFCVMRAMSFLYPVPREGGAPGHASNREAGSPAISGYQNHLCVIRLPHRAEERRNHRVVPGNSEHGVPIRQFAASSELSHSWPTTPPPMRPKPPIRSEWTSRNTKLTAIGQVADTPEGNRLVETHRRRLDADGREVGLHSRSR